MRGCLLAFCAMLMAGCQAPPAAKPTFDAEGMKPAPDGETATLTGWFRFVGRDFQIYPTMTAPTGDTPCLSGVLLSLAGVPTPDFADRPMKVSGYVANADDPSVEGVVNPCKSAVVISVVDLEVP